MTHANSHRKLTVSMLSVGQIMHPSDVLDNVGANPNISSARMIVAESLSPIISLGSEVFTGQLV